MIISALFCHFCTYIHLLPYSLNYLQRGLAFYKLAKCKYQCITENPLGCKQKCLSAVTYSTHYHPTGSWATEPPNREISRKWSQCIFCTTAVAVCSYQKEIRKPTPQLRSQIPLPSAPFSLLPSPPIPFLFTPSRLAQ